MSTLSQSPSVSENPVAVLAEAARVARATYDRVAAGKTQREQETARIAEALTTLNDAEAALGAAQAAEARQIAERDRLQRLQAIDAQLAATTQELDRLQLESSALPGRIYRVRAEAMRLMAERSTI